jgi:hypothetical protein
MCICKNLNIEAKRSKLMLNCESSEAKRTCSIVEKIISKRCEHVHIEEFEYRSEANRFDRDFVFKKTEKSELSFFFKNEGQKTKGFDSKLSKFCHCYSILGRRILEVTLSDEHKNLVKRTPIFFIPLIATWNF